MIVSNPGISYLVPVRMRVIGLRGRDGGIEGGRQLPAQAVLHVGVEAEGEEDWRQLYKNRSSRKMDSQRLLSRE